MRPMSSGAIEMAIGRRVTAGIFGKLSIRLTRSGLRLEVASVEAGMGIKMGRAEASRALVNVFRRPAEIVICMTVQIWSTGAIGFEFKSDLFFAMPMAARLRGF